MDNFNSHLPVTESIETNLDETIDIHFNDISIRQLTGNCQKQGKEIDFGFVGLKNLNPRRYPHFDTICRLYVDHNYLKSLPLAIDLPHLTHLTCNFNKLTDIVFYPTLIYLSASHNQLQQLTNYHQSALTYLDCSYNPLQQMDSFLPNCLHLYLNNTCLTYFHLKMVPQITHLDCSENKLTSFLGSSVTLLELAVNHNLLTVLTSQPALKILMADHNYLIVLPTFPNLVNASVCCNQLTEIENQPSLVKLLASENRLTTIQSMPCLQTVDFSCNQLTHFIPPVGIHQLLLHFNPLVQLLLESATLTGLQELSINFKTYHYIYQHYLDTFDFVDMQISEKVSKNILAKADCLFTEEIQDVIFKIFVDTPFHDRHAHLLQKSILIYRLIIKKCVLTDEKLQQNVTFIKLYRTLLKIYHQSLIVLLYFNDYYP